jgi:hypothetical protein
MHDERRPERGWLFRLTTTLGARQSAPAWPVAAADANASAPDASAVEPAPEREPEPRQGR